MLEKKEQLASFEEHFQRELDRQKPRLLGDLFVKQEEVNKLGTLIGNFLKQRLYSQLSNYPLSVSLFLVWASVYHYKEGHLWDPIFNKLDLEQTDKDRSWLGETLLKTINVYKLQAPPIGKGKKYMTPILMHGYISEYYAPHLLKYLNAVYGSYLEYDLSEQSLSNLWMDLFNFDQEQIKHKDRAEQLRRQELDLQQKIESLQVPHPLNKDSLAQAEYLEQAMRKYENRLAEHEEKLEKVHTESLAFNEAIALFKECAAALSAPSNLIDSETKDLVMIIEAELNRKTEAQKRVIKEVQGEIRGCENVLKITSARRIALLKGLVKLGGGSLDKGQAILKDYTALMEQQEEIRARRLKREKLLRYEDEISNSSLRQVLTTSLTTLGQVNPIAFQEFIKSALFLLESYARSGEIPDNHRLSNALKRSQTLMIKREKGRRSAWGASTNKEGIRTQTPFSHLRWTNLNSPELRFVPETAQLLVTCPAQTLPIPANYTQPPSYFLNYSNKEQEIQPLYFFNNKELNIQKTRTEITDHSVAGLSFNWYNLRETWNLKLESIMLFDERGKLQRGQRLGSGFYYILAKDDWKTASQEIIAQYPSRLSGCTVYEFMGNENKLAFKNPEGKETTFLFSKYAELSVENIEFIPGLNNGKLPVAKGSPKLIINKKLLAEMQKDAIFTFHYNNGLMLTEKFSSLVEYQHVETTEVNYQIDLVHFFPNRVVAPWQVCEIQVANKDEEVFYQKAFTLVRGIELSLEAEYLKVKVLKKSRVQGLQVERKDGVYWISCHSQSQVDFNIFFDRIGWKHFTADIPYGKWTLSSAEELPSPLNLIHFETYLLRDITLEVEPNSGLKKVVVFADEKLSLSFNPTGDHLEVPLSSFADLYGHIDEVCKIEIQFEGDLGASKPECIAAIFPELKINDAGLFYSEEEEEYVLELSYSTDYPDFRRFRFRIADHLGKSIFERSLRANPDYFFLKKGNLTTLDVKAQIYYIEEIYSIFGNRQDEKICWQTEIVLPNAKKVFKRLVREGLVLTGFSYKGVRYALSGDHKITNIKLTQKNFAGEELLQGAFTGGDGIKEVSFYLEDDGVIAFLWDEDNDGVQYDPKTGRMFWELTARTDVLAPLENLEFKFLGSDKNGS